MVTIDVYLMSILRKKEPYLSIIHSIIFETMKFYF